MEKARRGGRVRGVRSALLAILALVAAAVGTTLSAPVVSAQTGGAAGTLINSKIVFASDRDGNREIYAMNPDGSGQTRLTNNSATDGTPSLSPDGSKIAFESARDGNFEVYAMNADGSSETRLTNNADLDTAPKWSPDGSRIVFMRGPVLSEDVWMMNADGSNQTRLTILGGRFPSWSPDGSKIAFDTQREGNPQVYVMATDGTGQANISHGSSTDGLPAWSPDAKKLAFISDREGHREIWSMNSDGSSQTRLTNTSAGTDEFPAWSLDGSKIAFESNRDGNAEIYVMNSDGSGQTRLTTNPTIDERPHWGTSFLTPAPSTTTTSTTSTSTSTSTTSTTSPPQPVDRFAITSYDRMAPGAPHFGYFARAFQSFTAQSNRITYLGVTVGTPGYTPDGHTVRVRLCADSGCNTVLAEANPQIVNYGNSAADIGDVGVTPGQQYYVVWDQPAPWNGQPWVTYWWAGGSTIGNSDQMQAVVKGYNSSAPPTVVPPPPVAHDCEAFVADVTIPDGTRINWGATFTKTWRLRNCGNTNWSGLTAVRIGGSFGPTSFGVPLTAPGAATDMSVPMTAPKATGTFRSTYTFVGPRGRVADSTGNPGSFWVEIRVLSSSSTPPPPPGGPPPPPGGPSPGPTPPTQARYVALGDSYSSGEGVEPFTDTNGCHRSVFAYPRWVADSPQSPTRTLEHWACSGALTKHLYMNIGGSGQHEEGPQFNHLAPKGQSDRHVGLVTMSIGGNDAGFPEVVAGCINIPFVYPNRVPCRNTYDSITKQRIANLADPRNPNRLRNLYREIQARAPNAKIMVLTYPRLFPGSGLPRTCNGILRSDAEWMNSMNTILNHTIAGEVRSAGGNVRLVPGATAFQGHELCTKEPWFNGISLTFPDEFFFHPNATGQFELATLVENRIKAL